MPVSKADKHKRKSEVPSLGDVAREAGISRTAAGYALQNRPGVSPATRQRVARIARELGYIPDPRMAAWMSRVRENKTKDLIPIAWLNTTYEQDAWRKYKFHSPFLEGARERCLQLGYRLDEIWTRQPGVTMRRVSQILYQRGIEGAIVTYPARHFQLKWDHLAGIALGGALLAPRLHRVMPDNNYNLLLTLKMLRRYGYRRIGICLMHFVDRLSHHVFRSIANDFLLAVPKSDQVPPLFYLQGDAVLAKQLTTWMRRYRPDAIVGFDNKLLEWVQTNGDCVPEDIGIVSLAIDDDILDWAGIYSHRYRIGRTAAEQVISLIQNRQFGVPDSPFTILIPGEWRPGRTLLTPKPRQLLQDATRLFFSGKS
jgi:LacI family transcriptional regulator